MTLKVYASRMSQPSRAVLIFCKFNGIEFEEVKIDFEKREQFSPEYKEVNPMRKVPTIVDGRFKLFESHAILIYIASVFPQVAHHWYPADLFKRAKIHSVLDWHHLNLRRGTAGYVHNSTVAPLLGVPLNPKAAAEDEKLLRSSLYKLETVWLKGSGRFLLGGNQPSIADLSLVCEIMQLELLDEQDRNRILGPYKKVQQWIEDTRKATQPHFDEVHKALFRTKERLQKQRTAGANSETESNVKPILSSKMINGIEFEEVEVGMFKREQLSPESTLIGSNDVLFTPQVSGIEFEEFKIDFKKREQFSPEYEEINPMNKVPTIVDGRFKLFESHAILIHLASVFPQVAHHWYPADLFKRANIHSVLDWHHLNLRHGAVGYVLNSSVAPLLGEPLNPQAAAEGEKLLCLSLYNLETIWLKGSGRFLLGGNHPSIADLSLVCEIMQLELLDEQDRNRILGPYRKVRLWIEDTRKATQPHFDEVHKALFRTKERLQKQRTAGANSETVSNIKPILSSKM
ncbi:hypothetical protein Tsubulata_004488 [Turnera subulata]|uniref:glutathione transferase n=1 Tax=Turnera subulata TaxID=218843 RepID=A0A9Q0F354_9ROSI|nr:hypothetical protein Tsubulata_004488 [Turnera subulata]